METQIEYCAITDQEVVLEARYLFMNIGGREVKLLTEVCCSAGSVGRCKEYNDCKMIDAMTNR